MTTTTTTTVNISDVVLRQNLEATLDRLRTYGWIKKQFGDRYHTKGFCIAGAATDAGMPFSVCRALAETLRERNPSEVHGTMYTGTVIRFNDHPDTTWEDVEELFEHTIAGLKT